MDVEARFSSPVSRVRVGDSKAARYLVEASDCEDNTLQVRDRSMRAGAGGITCVRYSVDLGAAARDDRRNRLLSRDNVVVSPRTWLWRPALKGGATLDVHFELPDGIRVSVPWTPVGANRYRLSASPGSGSAVAAFGDFIAVTRRVGDAQLRIALLKTDSGYDYNAFSDWLAATAANVMYAYDRFPYPNPQVVVVPVGGSGWQSSSPVPYGRVLRDGGEAIELFINQHVPMEAFYRDWTATHEFSHLMLPYVTIRQRWVSEGFAQYYQNVLLARAGVYDERLAWQKLYEGLERGRRSRPELSPNESSSGNRGRALMKMYWSGAAIALKADVELRRRSGGSETLDTVLGRLETCCLPSDRVWRAEELFAQLDTLLDEPLFMPLYRRYADTPGFPAYDDLLARLGVSVERNRVSLNDAATWSEVRRAITGPTAVAATSVSSACSSAAAVPCPRTASAPPVSVRTSETE